MTTEKLGLRERKKDETRRTISGIALRLAIERGVGKVRVEDIAAVLGGRPLEESLKGSLQAAVLAGFPESSDRQWLARMILLRDDPTLIGAQRKAEIEIERDLAKVIAERIKKDLTRDIYPSLLAAMLIAAIRAAIFFWVSASPGGPTLHEILDQAISQLVLSS